ncbi:unnamed protein product, partial [Polarella glacialis]
ANLLRKWAREGRPYRGQVFQLQEVEDAIRAVAAQLVAANGTAVAAETLKAKQEAAAQGAASQEAGEKSLGDVTMPSGNDEEIVEVSSLILGFAQRVERMTAVVECAVHRINKPMKPATSAMTIAHRTALEQKCSRASMPQGGVEEVEHLSVPSSSQRMSAAEPQPEPTRHLAQGMAPKKKAAAEARMPATLGTQNFARFFLVTEGNHRADQLQIEVEKSRACVNCECPRTLLFESNYHATSTCAVHDPQEDRKVWAVQLPCSHRAMARTAKGTSAASRLCPCSAFQRMRNQSCSVHSNALCRARLRLGCRARRWAPVHDMQLEVFSRSGTSGKSEPKKGNSSSSYSFRRILHRPWSVMDTCLRRALHVSDPVPAAPEAKVDGSHKLVLFTPPADDPENRREVVVDAMLSGVLREHQRIGVQFMYDCLMGLKDFNGSGCILADDMGLGKTLQSVAVIWTLLTQGGPGGKPACRKALVVCPASLVKNWQAEFEKWLHGKCKLTACAVTGEGPFLLLPVMCISVMFHWAFMTPAELPTRGSAPQLRATARASNAAAPKMTGSMLPTSALFVAAADASAAVAHRAEGEVAVKKKGVKVVHGQEIPWNIFSPEAPYQGKVVKNQKHAQTLTEPTGDANWETAHVTIDHGGNVPYLEGQSIGIIAPGPDKKGETPARIRLYSIASSAVGDDETSKTVTLCVKRNFVVNGEHVNREVGEDKPDKAGTHYPKDSVYRGVCSNHVCDLSVGEEVLITGPTGTEMLLPEDQESNIIMLATGTGIAPMRSYMRLLFNGKAGANADGSRKFKGLAWLFMGVPFAKSLLYDDLASNKSKYPDQFRFDYAVSREQKNAAGQKMYIQTRMAEHAEEIWEPMQSPKTHVYMCGLKGMEVGMAGCFGPIAEKAGMDWLVFAKTMKKADRYPTTSKSTKQGLQL